MSIASQPAVFGMCIVGTTTGNILVSEAYSAPRDAAVAPVIAAALASLWSKLPTALDCNGPSRFDFLIRQQADNGESIDLYWSSGMSAGTLFSTVARKMLKVQATLPAAPAVEAREVSHIEWDAADHSTRVLALLDEVRADPWRGSRA